MMLAGKIFELFIILIVDKRFFFLIKIKLFKKVSWKERLKRTDNRWNNRDNDC